MRRRDTESGRRAQAGEPMRLQAAVLRPFFLSFCMLLGVAAQTQTSMAQGKKTAAPAAARSSPSEASEAQNAPIIVERPPAVGAITRDPELYLIPHDVATINATRRMLLNLESDLANKLSSLRGISYQDRTATQELLHEVHATNGRDFDPTSGALRGLMGRLDFLIVIDAVDRSTARMRLIDVQSGAVRGVESCVHRAAGAPSCVQGMASKLAALGNESAGQAADLVAARQDVMRVKPNWDDAVARYDAARAYWARIQSQIAPGGHTLRPEIQTLLNGSAADVSSGRFAVEHLDAQNLAVALKTLTAKLDELDSFR